MTYCIQPSTGFNAKSIMSAASSMSTVKSDVIIGPFGAPGAYEDFSPEQFGKNMCDDLSTKIQQFLDDNGMHDVAFTCRYLLNDSGGGVSIKGVIFMSNITTTDARKVIDEACFDTYDSKVMVRPF